jgi:hypothetical protein
MPLVNLRSGSCREFKEPLPNKNCCLKQTDFWTRMLDRLFACSDFQMERRDVAVAVVLFGIVFVSLQSRRWAGVCQIREDIGRRCAEWCQQVISLSIYRLTLHPYAKYPGPFLAKLTTLYAVYYAYTGEMHLDIERCHKRYGKSIKSLDAVGLRISSIRRTLRSIWTERTAGEHNSWISWYESWASVPRQWTTSK